MPKKKGNTRVTGKEQYYTDPVLAVRLCEVLFRIVGSDAAERKWIEPAGGTGSFVEALRQRGVNHLVSFDIEPHHPLVQQGDFLSDLISLPTAFVSPGTTRLSDDVTLSDVGMVAISNPPFGRANKLCIPFFNKLANHCDYIGFIVPKSWRKWSVQNRLDYRFHLIHDEDLVINYVDANGEPLADGKTGLNTVFQIWEKREVLRPKWEAEDRGYISKTNPDDADVSLTIFGRGCGNVKTEFQRVPNTTQMFLKLNTTKSLEALQNANFKQFYQNTAYTEALSIVEINAALNEYFDNFN